jgi:hypothetical protein
MTLGYGFAARIIHKPERTRFHSSMSCRYAQRPVALEASGTHAVAPHRRRLAAAEGAGEEAAGGRAVGELVLQLVDAVLRLERLLLHQDGLRHVVGCAGLVVCPLVDECLGISIAWDAATLDLREPREQSSMA